MSDTKLVSHTKQSETTRHENFAEAWSVVSKYIEEFVNELEGDTVEIDVNHSQRSVSILVIKTRH